MFDDLIPQQPSPPKYEITPTKRAFLKAVSAGESPDYNTVYGGGRFEEMNDHPRRNVPIRSGPNAGRTSSAAGLYQFLAPTWDEAKATLGLPDFSPESQDTAAAWLAERDYKARTKGRDLWGDLEKAKDNPQALNFIGGTLSKTWTSLPSGIEPNQATAGFGQRLATEFSSQRRVPTPAAVDDAAAKGAVISFDDLLPAAPREAEGPQKPKAADVGQGTAALEGYLSGASANFRDEIYGASEASGLPRALGGFRAPIGGARLLYEFLSGQPGEATQAYDKGVAEKRQIQKDAQEQYPGTYTTGQVGGAVIMPTGKLQGATMGARALRGGVIGGGYGALSGAGEGEDLGDRAVKATTGGALGFGLGAAGVPVVETVIQAGRAVARPVINAVRGALNPDDEAARRIATTIHRDVASDPQATARLTPNEYQDSLQTGGPARIMDLGGEGTRALSRSAANTSPEGRRVLNETINERFEGQTPRITQWFRETFHFPDAAAQQEAIETVARQVNRPAYQRAYQEGNAVWSPELERLAQAPAIIDAANDVSRGLGNRGIAQGFQAARTNPLVVENGRTVLRQTENGNQVVPDLAFWDQVKRNLDSAIGKAQRAGDGPLVSELTSLRAPLVRELDAAVPSYAQARAGAAHFFRAENALEAGQNYVTANFATPETRRALAQMSATERQLFQDGFVSRYIETLERTGDRRNILNKIAESPAAREKLNIAIGPQRAAELEARLRVEGIMDLARGAVQGNSSTATQLYNLGLAGGAVGSAGGLGLGIVQQDPTTMTISAVTAALVAGRRGIDQRVARRVAEMLVSDDPQLLQRGLQIVARNGRFMDALRSTDKRIAQISGQESPKALLPSSVVGGRAEDDEPRP